MGGYGRNVKATMTSMDKRICDNIRNLFITNTIISCNMPGNMHRWTDSVPNEPQDKSEFDHMFSSRLTNLEKVAISVNQSSRDLAALRTILEWFSARKIRFLELAYPDTPGREFTSESCHQLIHEYAMLRSRPALQKKWKAQRLSGDELDARGRYWSFEKDRLHWTYRNCSVLAEGTVFRLRRELIPEPGDELEEFDLPALRHRSNEEQDFLLPLANGIGWRRWRK
ncbi:hypothetical protein ABW19_dt0201892 [Dactylella cylindrospora]|nr:hypothetical protein ABW19_dt0201892 [Dactylella cylindrospora]